jgi:tetratricopeptide (TPR) repeat protein
VQAKGFEEGLTAFPVEGLSTRSTRRTIPFVGRADELALLRRSFSRVVRAGRPMLVTVAGEPGIGKTRLVEEFLASIGPDVTVLVGRSELSGDSATFGPASSIVCEAAGIQDDDTREKALRRVRELLEPLIPSGDLDRTTARLALLLGFSEERREESVFVQEVQTGFLELIDALAATRPVALQFEDVHELRPPMLDLIERTASSGRRRGSTFTLSTARPELHEERPAWGAGSLNHVSLRLEPLSDDEAVALARQAGGNELREDEAVTVAARAGGNPFFIVESTGMLLRHLHDAGEVATALLPPTVQAMIAARLDALPHAQRDLARRLAVYLYSFDVSEAALVSAACSEADLSDLVDAEIVVREEGTSPPRWRFRHETLRDVAYAGLPKRMRMELHVTIADAMLESRHPTWAADHLEKAALASLDLDPSRRGLPERASDALVRAGDRAQRRMESRSAIDYYERALALAGAQDRWGGREAWALAGIGESRYWLGDYPGATETLDQAIELGTRLSDDRALSHALRYRGDIAINVEADVARAEALLSGSLEAAERIEDQEAITRTLLFAGWVPWTRERYEEADPIWRRALELSRVIEDRWAEVRALTSLSINAEQMGRLDQASTLIEEAEAVAEETGDRFSVAVTATQRGRIDEDHMRYEDAIPHFERAVEIFGELGARWELGDALAERGIVKRELGRLDEAEEDLRQAVRISEELGERQLASWTWRALALVAERRGDHTEAETRRLRAAEAEARRPR